MTLETVIRRVRQKIEDPNSDVFGSQQVIDEINEAKDVVVAKVTIFSDELPQASEELTFEAGQKEITLSTRYFGVIRVESTIGNDNRPLHHRILDFRQQDNFENELDYEAFYVRWMIEDDLLVAKLGRRFIETEKTVTLYYIRHIGDSTTGSDLSAEYLFLPDPATNLIITTAALNLLGSRKRKNERLESMEMQQTGLLQGVLQQLNKSGPRFVGDNNVFH